MTPSIKETVERLRDPVYAASLAEGTEILIQQRREATALIERLAGALENLIRRLDDHFGGPQNISDWKEQEEARRALSGEPTP